MTAGLGHRTDVITSGGRAPQTVILGAGALGSLLAAYLTLAGQDVTLVARGQQLSALRDHGLRLTTPSGGTPAEVPMRGDHARGATITVPVKAVGIEECSVSPDLLFVAVKEYALEEAVGDIIRLASSHTTVVPLLNAIGSGDRLAARLPFPDNVLEGLAYVGAARPEPGAVTHSLDFFRVVLGPRSEQQETAALLTAAEVLRGGGLQVDISHDMVKSTLTKFVRVAALSGALIYVNGTAGDIAARPDALDFLSQLCAEIRQVGDALGSPLDGDPGADLLQMVQVIPPGYRTSLKEDLDDGRPAEIKSQFLDVLARGREAGVSMPAHERVIEILGVGSRPEFRTV